MPHALFSRWGLVPHSQCAVALPGFARLLAAAAILAAVSSPRVQAGGDLVHAARLVPGLVEDIRYATARNFMGRPLPGYDAPKCLLQRPVAEALGRVQHRLAGLSPPLALKVFDCYRPMRAVRAMAAWTRADAPRTGDAFYYPDVPRQSLIARGYISDASTHARGVSVDLTLARAQPATGARSESARTRPPAHPGQAPPAASGALAPAVPGKSAASASDTCRDRGGSADDARELDMGTTFDCFDPRSHTRAGGLTREQRRNRALLVEAMHAAGFQNYRREWWHFTYLGLTRSPPRDVSIR